MYKILNFRQIYKLNFIVVLIMVGVVFMIHAKYNLQITMGKIVTARDSHRNRDMYTIINIILYYYTYIAIHITHIILNCL